MLSPEAYLAMMMADTQRLREFGAVWFDRARGAWRSDWPLWMWPSDPRPYSPTAVELADKHGLQTPLVVRQRSRRVVVIRRPR